MAFPALSALVGNRAYGVNATLEVCFSAGVPWHISVITNDTPAVNVEAGDDSLGEHKQSRQRAAGSGR